MAKPAGKSGFFQARVGADGEIVGYFERIPFAKEKAEIETYMVERFIVSMNKGISKTGDRFFLDNPRLNPEDDFDFTVSSPNGPAYLELMEIAPLAGSHEKAPSAYKPYDFGKVILSGIRDKSNRYPTNLGRDLFLLLYVTHWFFMLSDVAVACLRHWLRSQPTIFRAIFTYELLDANEGVPRWLYPVPPELIGPFDPEQVRENVCLHLDPQGFQIAHERKS
ncbi:MAG: hypothetical protein CAF45_008960 [Nitrospira sp. CG24E]|nr:MAG: hypothetical protein CAF45_008960 [Nitrospira sp. CG24E]